MNPPILQTETDCKECKGTKGYMMSEPYPNPAKYYTCKACQGKSKTTKLIFKAEGCECPSNYFYKKGRPYNKHPLNCNCKGTGLILPKKGEVIEIDIIKLSFDESNEHDIDINPAIKKFRLTSDAVVKNAVEIDFPSIELIDKHNLKESDRLVICEGYYE